MFFIEGIARSPSYVAEQIKLHWVESDSRNFFNLEDLHIPENKKDLFFAKIYLLCEAATLRVLLTEAEKDERYLEVVREFERIVLPLRPTPEGMVKLEALKVSMGELNELFAEQNKELSWCKRWFEGIHHHETNPTTLFRFACLVGNHTTSLRQLIRDIAPAST